MEEIWRDIPGYEGRYQVSNLGRVKSLPQIVPRRDGRSRWNPGRVLKPESTRSGHLAVHLCSGPQNQMKKVHQLVAAAFLGEKPSEVMEVCHNDGNPKNNRATNLRYDTHQENLRDYVRQNGSTCKKVLTVESAKRIKSMLQRGMSQVEIARACGVSRWVVQDIARGRTWAWVE